MHIQQLSWDSGSWQNVAPDTESIPSLVLFFGGYSPEETTERYLPLREMFPDADIVGCSTAGEISDYDVLDGGGVAIAVSFDKTETRSESIQIREAVESYEAGSFLARNLSGEGLQLVWIISDGSIVNGSELVKGFCTHLDEKVVVAGGMAGDGGKFLQSGVSHNGPAQPGLVAAIGFYGDSLQVGWGAAGGWKTFGPERKITRAEGNVLFEFDSKPALGLYKTYLGSSVAQLPGSALSFPIMIRPEDKSQEEGLVRTILSVDEEEQTLTFAGDTPEGYTAQLMMASYEGLIDGAGAAGQHASTLSSEEVLGDRLVLMISCIGRKLVLGSRIEEEVEMVIDHFPESTHFAGYYSYGEINPQGKGVCELHNQTMTITYLAEKL